MCGFLGQLGNLSKDLNYKYIETEIKPILEHRGPDNFSYLKDDFKNLFFSHWRLSIIDLSSNSNQPIKSFSQRYIMIFNGEIYNYKDLSKILFNNNIKHFQNSDSSILINLFELYDLDHILKNIEGMYSFVLFDKKENILYLCRDNFGEKPLYYYSDNKKIIFSSEIKGILKLLEKKDVSLSLDGLQSYLNYGYFGNSKSAYKNIFALEPGTHKAIKNYNFEFNKNINYFDQKKSINLDKNNYVSDSNQAIKNLDKTLNQTINKTLIADVPVGIFLSGGVDSALIGYYASKKISNLKTFTVSFDDQKYDELDRAKTISNYIGSKNYNIVFKPNDYLDTLEKYTNFFDQPFSDSSFIPMFLLSKIASKEVKVCLGGDGADEIFYGYEKKYNLSKKIFNIPSILKTSLRYLNDFSFINNKKLETLSKFLEVDSQYLPILLNSKLYLKKYLKNSYLFEFHDEKKFLLEDFANSIKNFDIKNYLNNNILYKVDFASMKNSLEVRSPYLNKKIYDFSNKHNNFLFRNYKFFNKYLFKNKFKNIKLSSKKGFSVPLDSFLKNEMNEWMKDIIHSSNNDSFNIINKKKLISFVEKENSNYEDIWPILIYLYWETRRCL